MNNDSWEDLDEEAAEGAKKDNAAWLESFAKDADDEAIAKLLEDPGDQAKLREAIAESHKSASRNDMAAVLQKVAGQLTKAGADSLKAAIKAAS